MSQKAPHLAGLFSNRSEFCLLGMSIQTRGYHPKIEAMKRGQMLRQELNEQNAKRINSISDNREHFLAAREKLSQVDQNWEVWYDANVPDEFFWLEVEPIIKKMHERILSITGSPFEWKRVKEKSYSWEITRPAKRGKKRVTVIILNWYTKREFANWWIKYRQHGWTARQVWKELHRMANGD